MTALSSASLQRYEQLLEKPMQDNAILTEWK